MGGKTPTPRSTKHYSSILRNDFDLAGAKNGVKACWGLILALTLAAMVSLLAVRFTLYRCEPQE